MEAFLEKCRELVGEAEDTRFILLGRGASEIDVAEIDELVVHANRQIDQTNRRILLDETIPHKEKVFSIFEEHTRWISKGNAGVSVEPGVPVAVVEDQFQFILHHQILWEGGDRDAAVAIIDDTQERFPELRSCSFDRGFHRPANRTALDARLDLNALPATGYLSADRRRREAQPDFAEARQQHPAVESAINNLEHRGLDRIRTHGKSGFARTAALSVLAANVHRIGIAIRAHRREQLKRNRRRAA